MTATTTKILAIQIYDLTCISWSSIVWDTRIFGTLVDFESRVDNASDIVTADSVLGVRNIENADVTLALARNTAMINLSFIAFCNSI
jgi:hypothetical protein